MKQIVPGLWQIDEIGDAVQCYLWRWSGGVTLIDCGMPADGKKILAALLAHGYALHNVRRIIITHVDMDHTGGLPDVRKATGASIVCHTVEKEYMEYPHRRKMASPFVSASAAAIGLLPAFQQKPSTPDIMVIDGETLPEGFTVIHTPGHTPGHISLLHKEARLLIAGDALTNRRGKLSGPAPAFTPDMDMARRSIYKLAKVYGDDYETIVFGHGQVVQTNGGKRVRALASKLFSEAV